jgi:glucan phosphoethanolaminetransferase (alkaline phosphatase superfamily)
LNISNIIIGHIYLHWGYLGNLQARLEAFYTSPKYETVEYMTSYIGYEDILLVIYTFIILLLLYKFLVHFKHSLKILKYTGYVVSTSLLVLVSYRANPLIANEPFSIPYELIEVAELGKIYNERINYLNGLEDTVVSKEMVYDKVVVVQGEAVNKHHMAIYNYEFNTTPYLSGLKNKNELYVFNAISPTNQTRYSVPILHTKANVHNFLAGFMQSKSIVNVFKTYGYKTYWISNQGLVGMHDRAVVSMANEATKRYFENLEFYTAKTDETILQYLKNMQKVENKEMYFIHLMGSHDKYTERYSGKQLLNVAPKNITEEYDNTIFYTDSILEDILTHFTTKFKNSNILLIYISDHGEVVNDQKHGHGYLPPYKDEYDIPFVIYSNVKNSRIDKLYQDNRKGIFNLENLNYMIEYIAGLREDSNVSYSNGVFSLHPKNLYNYKDLKFYQEEK